MLAEEKVKYQYWLWKISPCAIPFDWMRSSWWRMPTFEPKIGQFIRIAIITHMAMTWFGTDRPSRPIALPDDRKCSINATSPSPAQIWHMPAMVTT